VTRRGGK